MGATLDTIIPHGPNAGRRFGDLSRDDVLAQAKWHQAQADAALRISDLADAHDTDAMYAAVADYEAKYGPALVDPFNPVVES